MNAPRGLIPNLRVDATGRHERSVLIAELPAAID